MHEESAWRSLQDVVGVILAASNPGARDGGTVSASGQHQDSK